MQYCMLQLNKDFYYHHHSLLHQKAAQEKLKLTIKALNKKCQVSKPKKIQHKSNI